MCIRDRQFQLDDRGCPTEVAGCPPDAFSEDGQLWGNPLFDWERMKRDGYQWWLHRVGYQLCLYDALRIDHFRGCLLYTSERRPRSLAFSARPLFNIYCNKEDRTE